MKQLVSLVSYLEGFSALFLFAVAMPVKYIGGVPFYMNDDQYEKWKHTDLTIDAVKGIGGMFSLDNGTGQRFLTKSEICLVVDNDKKN